MGRRDQIIMASLLLVFLFGLVVDWNFNRAASTTAAVKDIMDLRPVPELPTNFEYRSEIIHHGEHDAVKLDETLKRVGEVGWDLCTATETTLYGKPCLLLLLKRPL